MLDNLAIGGDKIIFTAAAGQPRAVEPAELQRRFIERRGRACQIADNIELARNRGESSRSGRSDLCHRFVLPGRRHEVPSCEAQGTKKQHRLNRRPSVPPDELHCSLAPSG